LVRRPDNDLWGAEAFSDHYSITERDTTEVAMQDATRRALSQYCSLFSRVADGLDLKYYPRCSTSSAGGVIVLPIGEGNPRLNNTVNLAAVLNTELDHALDELAKVRQRLRNCVLSAQHATIWMVVLPPLSGFSTFTVHRPMVASSMVPLNAGPR
jgi:hypothetical protein